VLPFRLVESKGSEKLSVAERAKRRAIRQQTLKDALLHIVKCVNAKLDHIPPVSNSKSVFPFQVCYTMAPYVEENRSDSF